MLDLAGLFSVKRQRGLWKRLHPELFEQAADLVSDSVRAHAADGGDLEAFATLHGEPQRHRLGR